MSSGTEVGSLFWAATHSDTTPAPEAAPAASSCCGPKPAAKTETAEAPAAKSSCCGPKPAAEASGQAPAEKKSSCCG
jgi:hypothetical protein